MFDEKKDDQVHPNTKRLKIKLGNEEILSTEIDLNLTSILEKEDDSESSNTKDTLDIFKHRKERCALCNLPMHCQRLKLGELIFFKVHNASQPLPNFTSKELRAPTNDAIDLLRSKDCYNSSYAISSRESQKYDIKHCCQDVAKYMTKNINSLPIILSKSGQKLLNGIANTFLDNQGRPFGLCADFMLTGRNYPIDGFDVNSIMIQLTEELVQNELVCIFENSAKIGDWGYLVHRKCLSWSKLSLSLLSYSLAPLSDFIGNCSTKACHFCLRAGASMFCQSSTACSRAFHYPCAVASGCFLIKSGHKMLCPDHIEESNAKERSSQCCEQTNNVRNFIFCQFCESIYHSSCLFTIDPSPTMRCSWQCTECKTCANCSKRGDENNMMLCDFCDQGCHTTCTNPPMDGMPSNGWRCDLCVICEDCGATNFAHSKRNKGQISNNFLTDTGTYLCEKCTSHRKKPIYCCTICKRACPSHAKKSVRFQKCLNCKQCVHINCDPSALTMGAEYLCNQCVNKRNDME